MIRDAERRTRANNVKRIALKNRKPNVNPLPVAGAAALRGYLAGKPHDSPVWPGMWFERAVDMVRADLAEAGISATGRDADGLVFPDFHAAGRHAALTHATRAGVPLTARRAG